ncbi:hypothetical protein B1218_36725, partial [Pseudomonas ogarae]
GGGSRVGRREALGGEGRRKKCSGRPRVRKWRKQERVRGWRVVPARRRAIDGERSVVGCERRGGVFGVEWDRHGDWGWELVDITAEVSEPSATQVRE